MYKDLLKEIQSKVDSSISMKELDEVRVGYLGKNGFITNEMKKLSSISNDKKKEFGKKINIVKKQIQELIKHKIVQLKDKELQHRLEKEWLDVSLSPSSSSYGKIHPITQATEELMQIFADLGFSVEEGPNIEDNWHNFSALNMDENHPARQLHDTFYLNHKEGEELKLLRTHTSPVQIRSIANAKPPIRFIAPGRTYRSDSDQTHTPMFHQLECVYIDENVNIGHLKYVINHVIKAFFEKQDIATLFRPSFFPFTEPSMEVDIKIPASDKWLEVLGCGMIHPKVLENVGIDTKKYRGFAFGMGIDRFAMLKYNIQDLRKFFEGDVHWTKHYGFEPFDLPSLMRGLTK